ncbi:N-acetylglucosamine-6-phosphate deacetylase [Amphiplicatus metriothermophilus]|uniref:N-acetylglucosamine 6-phosphate deacetylase n=1 Tax=Amphiplicatus metriothermophilus TaxID=1519374 RepID=A0A239PPB0_9PROT|nr:N-acetylglucosamine-6-phosphate deacetylase [Amphiplicatus metriothermophilus]MBB5518738.1 N-acetylglucosamine-6-phosphate deacetylase [Amphiplicatus metriothermophilus]SNT72105.1 N-acetylglucosamine 6-phosphate deacetylase [Amphiplicatus metriothermophilus]
MQSVLTNARILADQGMIEGHALVLEGARIAAIVPREEAPAGGRRFDLDGAILAPGFIDVQVNGGNGRLFNESPDVETIREIGAAHRRFGTTGFLPTLISDELDVIAEAVAAVDAAIAEGVPGVLGIHIEGPFLSTDKKGVHDPSKFRRLEAGHLPLLTALKRGRTLVTLAPENAPPELIRRLVAAGVIVSAGHTDATYDVTKGALAAGVTGFTHLFNAMSPMTSREPGVVGAALEDPNSWCGLIVDGRHVAPAVLKVALKCKPLDRLMLVTDAMPTVGMKEKAFRLQGRLITVEDGVCVAENGTLAGSDLEMARAVRNAAALMGLSLAEATRMASRHPAAFLGLDGELGRIAPGWRASLVAFDDDLVVRETWIDGVASGEAKELNATSAASRKSYAP